MKNSIKVWNRNLKGKTVKDMKRSKEDLKQLETYSKRPVSSNSCLTNRKHRTLSNK